MKSNQSFIEKCIIILAVVMMIHVFPATAGDGIFKRKLTGKEYSLKSQKKYKKAGKRTGKSLRKASKTIYKPGGLYYGS